MLVSEMFPYHGDYIVAGNSEGGAWVEQCNANEPLGSMEVWFSISEIDFNIINNEKDILGAANLAKNLLISCLIEVHK